MNDMAQQHILPAADAIASMQDHLSAALFGLALPSAADDANARVLSQQFKTAIMLLQNFVAEPDADKAAGFVAGWLRMVALQHPKQFRAFPFSYDDLDAVFADWTALLGEVLSSADLDHVSRILTPMREQLTQASENSLKVLFIGDCLIWDIATHLQIVAHSDGFDVEPHILARRLGPGLRTSIKALPADQFDLVFYSPFSFGFSLPYASATAPRNMHKFLTSGRASLREASDDMQRTLETIAKHFEGTVYVHTVSGIRQVGTGWRAATAHAVSRGVRRLAARAMNADLAATIDTLKTSLARPILRIDEAEPLRTHTERALSRVMFNAGDLHPTGLADALASGPYARACRIAAQLKGRKLVVVDLDHTMWAGVIGDGPIVQHIDRQRALLRLKSKGIVLSVSSKNDPANIRWDEAVFSKDDFVALEINWGRKASNIRKIADTLNLNPNSFVFLDDRADERATVTEELPGILALDPNEPEVWRMISEWTETLGGSSLKDRTALYQERMSRQSFLHDDADDDPSDAYAKLDLRATLRAPTSKDMARVVELINRTNQFNTTAARTSMAEMTAPNPERRIMLAEARDRFGEMGIVGVLVVTMGQAPEISHFVLSCRVFGFGLECAMVQSVLRAYAGTPITAQLVETPVNGPCRDVFEVNGFTHDGVQWIAGAPDADAVPSWLTVDDQTEKAAG